jgi:FixJ family two-component response regulator/HPt (histidine-containing phosphotransfer) domain-containing protein
MSNDFMLDELKIEASEMLDEAEESLLNLEKGESFQDNFNSIFRAMHSLKGAAGMFDLQDLQAHMHKLETLLESLKTEESIGKELVDYFLEGIDGAREILQGMSCDFHHKSLDEIMGGEASVAPAATPTSSPVANKVERPATKPVSSKSASAGRIAIVDDEEDLLDIFKRYLEDENFEVHTFTNGNVFLEKLQDMEFDTLISDIKMPEIDGVDLIREVHLVNPDLPVIFISAYLSKEIIYEILEVGAYSFIEKPFDENKLLQLCSQSVNRHRAMKLLNRSINFIMYQYSDLEKMLRSQGKDLICDQLKDELKIILDQKRLLRKLK